MASQSDEPPLPATCTGDMEAVDAEKEDRSYAEDLPQYKRQRTLITSVMKKFSTKSHEICEHSSVVCGKCASCHVKLYNESSRDEYNNFCPLTEKEIVSKDHAPWFDAEILRAKKEKKKKEKRWHRLQTDEARREYQDARNNENKLVLKRKREYYQSVRLHT